MPTTDTPGPALRPANDGLTPDQLSVRRAALEDERRRLLARAAELDEEADVSWWRDGGHDGDEADTGSSSYERERAQSLARHARRILEQVDDALRRMDRGSYGRCERCGRWIEFERLEAVPYATLCLDDKRREEAGR